MANLYINDKCNGCGGCEASGYVMELENGKFAAKEGIVVDNSNESMVHAMIKECPCQAIELQGKVKNPMNKNELISETIEKLRSIKEISHIETDDIKFINENYHVNPVGRPEGEYEYVYRSYSAAQSAGRDEFRRIMWNYADSLMQEVIVQYKCRVLSKYYDKNNEDNIYENKKKEVEQVLRNLIEGLNKLGVNAGNSDAICKFECNKSFEDDYEWLDRSDDQGYVNSILERSINKYGDKKYNFMESYSFKLYIDHTETYETGLFGREKSVLRYCYGGVRDCCDKMEKDVINAVSWSGLERSAKDHINSEIDYFNKNMQKGIEEKIRLLEAL